MSLDFGTSKTKRSTKSTPHLTKNMIIQSLNRSTQVYCVLPYASQWLYKRGFSVLKTILIVSLRRHIYHRFGRLLDFETPKLKHRFTFNVQLNRENKDFTLDNNSLERHGERTYEKSCLMFIFDSCFDSVRIFVRDDE